MKNSLANSLIVVLAFAGLLIAASLIQITYYIPLLLITLFVYLDFYYRRLFKRKKYNYLALGLLVTLVVVF